VGAAFQFGMFVHNDFGVMLLTFFFFSLAMTGYGYFIRSSATRNPNPCTLPKP